MASASALLQPRCTYTMVTGYCTGHPETDDSGKVITDFPPDEGTLLSDTDDVFISSSDKKIASRHGISSIPITYAPYKQQVEDNIELFKSRSKASCSICTQELESGKGIYAICPQPGCGSVTHLKCLSQRFLDSESQERSLKGESEDTRTAALIPIQGTCKECGGTVQWIDIVKELTLRMRGVKSASNTLKKQRAKALKSGKSPKRNGRAASVSTVDNEDDLGDGAAGDYLNNDLSDDDDELDVRRDDSLFMDADKKDEWHVIADSEDDDDDDIFSVTSTVYLTSPDRSIPGKSTKTLPVLIEDSE